jgi:hypothetical protein
VNKRRIAFEDCEAIADRIGRGLRRRLSDLRRARYTLSAIESHREPIKYNFYPDIGHTVREAGEPEEIDHGTLSTFHGGCLPPSLRRRVERGERFSVPSTGGEVAEIEGRCKDLIGELIIGEGEYPRLSEADLEDLLGERGAADLDPDIAYFCRPGKFSPEERLEDFAAPLRRKMEISESKYGLEPPEEPESTRDPYSGHTYHF